MYYYTVLHYYNVGNNQKTILKIYLYLSIFIYYLVYIYNSTFIYQLSVLFYRLWYISTTTGVLQGWEVFWHGLPWTSGHSSSKSIFSITNNKRTCAAYYLTWTTSPEKATRCAGAFLREAVLSVSAHPSWTPVLPWSSTGLWRTPRSLCCLKCMTSVKSHWFNG